MATSGIDHLMGGQMKKGDNIRHRADGRYEARYIKGRDDNDKIIYGYCYGQTYDEAKEKREYQLRKMAKPREMNLLILGAGMHGSDVCEIAKSLRIFNKINFLDNDPNKVRAIGKWEDVEHFIDEYPVALVAVGNEDTRRDWTQKLNQFGFITPTLIHPTAFISEETEIGIGSVIYPRVTIASGVHIGRGCIIGTGSTVPRKFYVPDWGYFEYDKIIRYKKIEEDALQ